jgi:hypothetical protein
MADAELPFHQREPFASMSRKLERMDSFVKFSVAQLCGSSVWGRAHPQYDPLNAVPGKGQFKTNLPFQPGVFMVTGGVPVSVPMPSLNLPEVFAPAWNGQVRWFSPNFAASVLSQN